MATFSNNLVAKSGNEMASKYYCASCDYKCIKKYNWNKHLLTSKHTTATNSNEMATEKWQKVAIYSCENCSKEYNDRSGLWRHQKKCVIVNTQYSNNELENTNETNNITQGSDKDDLINYLIKENQEFKNLILEIVKEEKIIKNIAKNIVVEK
jgi:hypothetical protein